MTSLEVRVALRGYESFTGTARLADAARPALGAGQHQALDAAICLCEGAFGLLGRGDDPLDQPLAILRRVEAALKSSTKCLFTVLNGFAMARRHCNEDVAENTFDPLGLTELSDVQPRPLAGGGEVRERGFVPTELTLLFQTADLQVLNIWGGTAGNWGRRPVDLDEMEIMVLACKAPDLSK